VEGREEKAEEEEKEEA